MRHIIAKYTAYDYIRDEGELVAVYEEETSLGHIYTIKREDETHAWFYERDTMPEALELAHSLACQCQIWPTNGGIPAFDEA